MKERKVNKRILYSICFFLFMVIDWTRGSQVGSTWAWTVNLTGVVMAVIIISTFDIKAFFKRTYLLYSIVCLIALVVAYYWWNLNQAVIYRNKLLTAIVNIWLLGLPAIKYFSENKKQKIGALKACFEDHKVWLELLVYSLLMVMFISVNEDVWPLWFLIIFIEFYHCDFSSVDKQDLLQGIWNGIIASFFVLQGLAFVFRPYDDPQYRYSGFYANCNMNALFYCVVWLAFLMKLFYVRTENRPRWQEWILYLFTAAVPGFVVFTMCKTAFLAMALIGAFYLIGADFVFLKKKAKEMVCKILLWGVLVCACIPIDYALVRYLPPVFHHPIWYEGEYSQERVHSFDAWDSEKYVSFSEMINEVTGRIAPFIQVLFDDNLSDVQAAEAKENEFKEFTFDMENQETIQFTSAVSRIYMWEYYFRNGTLLGHSNVDGHEIGLPVYVWHTQNVYIQFWYYYGIIAACLLAVVNVGALWYSVKLCKKRSTEGLGALLSILLFNIFGMLEAVWYPGQMILLLLFVMPLFIIRRDAC